MNCKMIIHFLVAVSLIINPLVSHGASTKGQPRSTNHTDVLRSAFLDPKPLIYGIETFLMSRELHTPEVTNLILKDPELANLVQIGEKTRTNFMDYMAKQFGDSKAFLMDPIAASIDMIQRISPDQNKRTERPIKESEAARLAWHETEQLYGLQATGVSFADIEQQRRTDQKSANIYAFYTKSYFKRLELESRQSDIVDHQPEALRRRLIFKIKEVRAANFAALLSEVHAQDQLELEFVSGPKLSLSSPRIEFKEWNSQTSLTARTSKYKSLWGKLGRLHHAYIKTTEESQLLSGIVNTRKFDNRVSSEVISLQVSNQESDELAMPISELWNLLSDLELVISERATDPAVAAAMRDTVARDLRLYELQTLISHARWNETAELLEQLETFNAGYILKAKSSPDVPSMIQQTSTYSDRIGLPSVIDKLRWSGYRFGAAYWAIRDSFAKTSPKDSTLSAQLSAKKPEMPQASDADTKIIRAAEKGRKKGFKDLKSSGRTFLAMGLSLMLAGTATHLAEPIKKGITAIKNFALGLSSNQISAEDDVSDPTNHSRKKSDSESEGGKGQAFFEIMRLPICGDSCPKYISIPTIANMSDVIESPISLSRSRQLELRSEAWNSNIQAVIGNAPETFRRWAMEWAYQWVRYDTGPGELVLQTTGSINVAKRDADTNDFVLPLPAPSNYLVDKVILLGTGVNGDPFLVDPESYVVYVDTWTGLQFAHFVKTKIDGPGSAGAETLVDSTPDNFKAIISYLPNGYNNMVKQSAADSKVSPWAISIISDRLLQSGLPELAGRLLMEPPKTLSQFSVFTENSSIYTYRRALPEKMAFRHRPYEVDFSYYQRFLIEGPSQPLFLQCTGAAALTSDLINTAITLDNIKDTKVERVQGFRFEPTSTGEDTNPTINGPGHQWNVISRTDGPFQYMELDGTPTEMDKKSDGLIEEVKAWFSAKPKPEQNPKTKQEKPKQQETGKQEFEQQEAVQRETEQPIAKKPVPKERKPLVRPIVAIRPEEHKGVQPGTGWESYKRLNPKPNPSHANGGGPKKDLQLSSLDKLIQARDQYWKSLSDLQANDPHAQFTEDLFVTRSLRLAAAAEAALAGQADVSTLAMDMVRIFDHISPKERGTIVVRYLERKLQEWMESPLQGTHPISKILIQNELETKKHLEDNSKSEDPVLWLSDTSVTKALLHLNGVLHEISGELADLAEGLQPGERCGQLLQ